jgi:hypothetical protein
MFRYLHDTCRTVCRHPVSLLCLLFGIISFHCAVTQPVRVLEPGEVRLTASIGGPIVPGTLPTVIVPYATAGGAFGVSEAVTATGNLHLVLAALKTVGIDGGAAVRLIRQDGAIPEVTAKGQALFMTNFTAGSFRVFPFCSVNGSYRLGESVLGYGGLESMFQFTGDDHYFLGPFAGVQFGLSRRIAMQTEVKWMAANVNTRDGIFEGESSVGGRGSIGFFLGISYVW